MDANAGVFEAILGQEDVIIADRLIHASLVDGIRLCSAEYDTFKHMDMKHLEKKLELHQDKRTRLIVTDGVFSMDGDLCPLDEMCRAGREVRRDGPASTTRHAIGLHRQDRPRARTSTSA